MASGFKKFLSFAAPIAGAMFGGPLGAAAGGAIGGAASGGAKGAVTGGLTGGLTGAMGAGAKAISPSTNYLSLAGGAGTAAKSAGSSGLFSGLMSGLKNIGGGIGNMFSMPSAMAATSSPASARGMMTGGSNPFAMASPALNYMSMSGSPMKQESSQGGLFSNLTGNKTLLGGLGLMGASQLLRSPKVPETPQSMLNFQQQASQGSQIGNLAQQRLAEQLNTPMQEVQQGEIDAAMRQLNLAKEQEMKQLTGTYKSLRPGTDITTDSSYARDMAQLNDRYARQQADIGAQLQRQVYNDFQGQRAQQIAQAQGLDVNRMAQLLQAGQLDLDRALDQMAMDYNDKQTLRNYLLQFGGSVVGSQIPSQNPFAFGNPYSGLSGQGA